METTRLSSKGQVIIPQGIREAHQWQPGIEFIVTETPEGLLLTPRMPYQPTTAKKVLGCLNYRGAKKSIAEMDQGIAKGARKQK